MKQEDHYTLMVPNYKVNRIKGQESSNSKKYVPITEEMFRLFVELNYTKYKETENYLIGNDEALSRTTMMNLASKGFSHFWKVTDSKKVVN